MNQSNTQKSSFRTLTQEEVNTVSGGFAWVPFIIGTVIKAVVIGIIENLSHSHKNNNDACHNSHDPGMRKP